MGEVVIESLEKTIEAFRTKSSKNIEFVLNREKMINGLEKEIIDYLVPLADKNLSDEEKLYQIPITYYNNSDLKITKEIEQKFIPMKEKKKTQEIDKSKGQGIGD